MSFVFEGHTAAEWRQMATDAVKRSQESWERSDTDGFLSQWASDTMARRYNTIADVADNNGMIEVMAAFTLDGTFASADMREGQYGAYFLIPDAVAKETGTRFFSPSNARKEKTRKANNAKKGFTTGTVRIPAYVDRASMVQPDLRSGKVEVISTDSERGDW